MRQFTTHTGTVAVLNKNNIDTDQIIPKQFLTSLEKTGFGDYLFDAWRYQDEGFLGKKAADRQPIASFVLNAIPDASILVCGENFGCGSSREHAVWALLDFGIRAVIAPSFADIFANNSVKNGLLTIQLSTEQVASIMQQAEQTTQYQITVDLAKQTVQLADGSNVPFIIEEATKTRLLKGLDDIQISLQYASDIQAFEKQHAAHNPWLFG